MAQCITSVAEAVSVQGTVEVWRADQSFWERLTRGDSLCAGDRVRADSHARAGILLGGHTLMRLDQRTTLTFPAAPTQRTWLELLKGALHFISRTPQRLEVETPFVNAAIEGTEFALRVQDARTSVWVYEGRVVAENTGGVLALETGDAAVATRGAPPRPQVVLDPREAVKWALYYPPLLDLRTLDAGHARGTLAQSVERYRTGDVRGGLMVLKRVPNIARDARWFNIQTALLLSVGRVEAAQTAIANARERDPQSAAPLAYEAIIGLTQNRNEAARDLARQAVALAPASPIAHAALSYARQASFDLEGALASARRAIELAPNDALAWARLSELELARGYSDAAVRAAEKARAPDPAVARTQSVLGFVNLARIDTDQATHAFNTAIGRDEADPLPRLGLGLAKIREGDLDGGRRDIEIAASLDPSQSIARSYLGKAYFEEKRSALAAEQYTMAKELDPNDPTPWFYDAILKQTENRPIEALQDIQRSIELNDNRAVYRSRLLLDEDLAARSASQARIYRDLGFEQLALVEGWKSVNTDPSNYGAHRLLADSYSTLPRHEIARVSELLQSQLLQPLNITPLQPQLAESDLLILEGAGPSEPSFNEFNPLFTRDRLGLQVSGIGGSNETLGEEVTHYGLWGPFSYSLGQFHFETDGFRENNDLEHDIYNAFVQASISPQTSVQVEFRQEETESGDLRLRFDRDAFDNQRSNIREQSLRLGLHHELNLGHDIIASLVDTDLDSRLALGEEEVFAQNLEAGGAEVRYLYRNERMNLDLGGGRFDQTGDRAFFFPQETDVGIRHTNAYGYTDVNISPSLVGTLGLSFDAFESEAAPLSS
ncbi:MAG: FecR domain-containing protein [Gammaproteobacteria bacterium]|nr:FecR domain-containing protein [Gammaproteobacteria bacterium]